MEKKDKKNITKMTLPLPIIIITLINGIFALLSIRTAYAASTYVYDSVNVGFDNNKSGLVATDVQGAINELYSCAIDYDAYNTRVKNEVYPVGSIYISVNSTNPSTLFGGTWQAFATGKSLVGIDANQTEFNTIEKTGGSKYQYLAVGNLPSHNHNIPQLSVSTWSGSHYHTLQTEAMNGSEVWGWDTGYPRRYGASYSQNVNSGSTTITVSGQTTTESSTGYTGDGNAFNIQDPYITVYMWKRTA